MTLAELYERLLWSLEDPALQEAVPLYVATDLINDALYDLADALHIVKYVSSLPVSVDGVVVLPEDLMYVERVRWNGDTDLKPIYDVNEAALGSGAVTQYMMQGLRKMQLYDIPTSAGTLEVWYRAYPPKLASENDEPSDVPVEYHEALATVYAKAQVLKRSGDLNGYNNHMGLWVVLKKEIRYTITSRTRPAVWTGAFEW